MKYEYLIFNAIVLAGPLLLSFDKKVRFYTKWPQVFPAIAISLLPFVCWDALVTPRHWWFNEQYTLDLRLFRLPPGEWLFFITVPYACLFLWEVLKSYRIGEQPVSVVPSRLLLAGALPGIWLFSGGREYTGLVLLALAGVVLADRLLKTGLWQRRRIYLFLMVCTVLMLIFNGYLTARPVVLYGLEYQLGVRIFTIPVEDFGYGYALLLLNVTGYEKLRGVLRV